ncbi:MAG TPA: arylsulfotransferase family protein [Solirubrobacteraceae bacterium]|nr:arylsulfotransferase family protein [Solirubrobacteraceae bacterium]
MLSKAIQGAAIVASVAALAPGAAQGAGPIGAYTTNGAWSFLSEPNLHPPKLHTDAPTVASKLAPGDFLTANFPNVVASGTMIGQGGPLILDKNLQPVWFDPVPTSVVALDLKQQTFAGKPALSWWEGVITNTGAASSGTVYVVDQHYRQVAKLAGDVKDGWVISPHEVAISGHDAWVTAYKYLDNVDLSAYGGATGGTLYDFAVQEYDLRDGKLLFSWDAFNPGGPPNVPLSESETTPAPSAAVPWDAYHGNSIQLVGTHEFLVSMRNTWAAYLVDARSGKVLWTLGGKASSFSIPVQAQFQWQHTVALLPNNQVTVYDDHCCAIVGAGKFAPPTGPSRGLVLKLDNAGHTASLAAQYTHSPALDSAFTGSMQLLTNGNALVGWGSQPYFSEYSKTGKRLLDAVWPGKDLSYRVLGTDTWAGTPYFPPRGAVRKSAGKTTAYLSWDGATGVASWVLLAGTGPKHLAPVATRLKSSFETAIKLPKGSYRTFQARALNANGKVIGTTKTFGLPHSGSKPPGLPQAY